jgi:hypothetical protein
MVLQDNWTSLIALHISILFSTKHSLITLPSPKGFFFLVNISVILYEVMVAALALLIIGLENIA